MISKKNYINLSGTKVVNKLNDLIIGEDTNDLMIVNSESKIEGELNVMKTTNLMSDLNVNGDKFNVKSDTGNTDIKGKLDVANYTNLKGDVVIGEDSNDYLAVNSDSKFIYNVDVTGILTTGEIDTSYLTVYNDLVVTGSTVTGLTKAHVSGIEYVENTSDANKPHSNQASASFGLKAPIANPTFTGILSGITAYASQGNTIYTAHGYGGQPASYWLVFNHNLGYLPYFVSLHLWCISTVNGGNYNYAVGDRLSMADAMDGDGGRNYNVEITTSQFIIRGDNIVLTQKNAEHTVFHPHSNNWNTVATWLKIKPG